MVLAVDGGNSKTDVAVVTYRGVVVTTIRGPTVSHEVIGIRTGAERLADLTRSALAAAGDATPRTAVYALAGADLLTDARALSAAIRDAGATWGFAVVNDAEAGLRAGTDDGVEIALVCGAGVNGVARSATGRRARFAALGAVSGDWGGGIALGVAAVGAAVRATDGRGPPTTLRTLVPRHFGASRPLTVAAAVERGRIASGRLGELAPVVATAARSGDPVALSIMERQSEELATMAWALAGKVGVRSRPIPVVLVGGVFRGYQGGLWDDLVRRIVAKLPLARVERLAVAPVAGAALLALEMTGNLTPRAAQRLRRAPPSR
jgi:N-acetylglucosamine kinase-like BadF-type ATPase